MDLNSLARTSLCMSALTVTCVALNWWLKCEANVQNSKKSDRMIYLRKNSIACKCQTFRIILFSCSSGFIQLVRLRILLTITRQKSKEKVGLTAHKLLYSVLMLLRKSFKVSIANFIWFVKAMMFNFRSHVHNDKSAWWSIFVMVFWRNLGKDEQIQGLSSK